MLLILLLGRPALSDDTNKTIMLSAIENEQTHSAAIEILREAYKRIGYSVTFELLPAKRSLTQANTGKTDGDVARISGTEKKFTNLIPVPTPIILFQGGVFTKEVKKKIKKWDDLNGLMVGIIRGIRYSEIGTRGMDRITAKDMTHLFKLLDTGRIDVAVAVIRAGKNELSNNFKGSKIHLIGKPIFKAPLYHFINKKESDLVPILDKAIQDMRNEGMLEKIYDRSLKSK